MKLYNYKYELLAYLDDMNPTVDKVLGGISTLSFTISKDVYNHSSGEVVADERFDLIENEKLVEYDNEFYIVKDCSPNRDELGIITKEVTCKHISVELSSTKVDGAWGYSPSVEYFEPPYDKPVTLQVALKDLLENHTSGWEIGISPTIEKNRTFEFEWNTPMEIIMDLSEVYNFIPHFRTEVVNGEIKKYVDILTDDYGEVKGYYRHDSTLSTIRKPINSDGITTRLYVFGYNDISINELYSETKTFNGVSYNIHTFGRSYVDNFDYFLAQGYTYEECLKYFVRVDQIKDDLYVDPTDLYDYAKDHISKVGMPTVSYTVSVNDVEFVGKPELELGHKIRIYDKEIGIDLIGRVSKINFNHDDPAAKTIEITNYYAYLSEIDLLTDLVLKQDKLGTTAIRRNSKFANSVVVNNVTGIVVQAKNSEVSTLGIDEEELMNYRDVVRIGQYEKDKYGIQVLDGQIQMDRQDGITRVNIDNQEGIVIYNNPNGDGFTDEHRVFYVDVEGKLVAERIVVKNGYYYLRDGQEIEAVISGINEDLTLVENGMTDVKASVDELEREQVRLEELTKAENIIATVTGSQQYIDDILSKVDSTVLAEESKRIEGLIATATAADRIVATVTESQKYAQDLLAKADSATVTATIDSVKTELQGKVDTVSGEVAQAKLDIEKTNQSLSLKAEKTEVYTKAETDLALSSKLDDGDLDGVIERISNTETQIQVQAGLIASKVEKTTYETAIGNINSALNSKADSSVVNGVIERVTSAESAITQTAEAIESKVSKSEYQTGMASKADNSTVTALTNRVSTAESTLTQHADSIALKASKTDVYTKTETDSKLESIEIGAVNLIRDSEFTASPSKWTGIGSLWKIDTVNKYDDVNIVYITRSGLAAYSWADITSESIEVNEGDSYTGSFYAKFSGFDGVQDYVLIRLYGYKADGTRVDIKEKMLSGSQTDWKRVVVTANIPTGVKTLRLAASMRKNGSCYLAKPKLEKGNKVTDWTTSPKDTMSRVESVESELKVQSDKIEAKVSKTDYAQDMSSFGTRLDKAESSITQTAESIESKVSKTEYAEDKEGILTRLGTAETGITQNAKDIALKASKTELTTGLAGKADSSTVNALTGRVSTAESELRVQAEQISQKVSKTEYSGDISDLQSAIDSKADESTLSALAQRVSTAESSITQTAEQITQKVSKTEYDKGLAGKADTSTVTALGTRLSTAETTLTQQAGQIALKASKTDVYTKSETDGKIDGIQIGGTNLLLGTGTAKSTNVNVATSYVTFDPYTTKDKKLLSELGFKAGDEVAISFNWNVSQNGSLAEVYGNFRLEWKGVSSSGTNDQYVGGIKSPVDTFSATNKSGKVTITTKLTEATIKAHSLRFRIDNSVLTFKVSNVKLEKGNKSTDWSPSPYDIETKVSAVEAELKVQSDAISQTVKKTDYDKTVQQIQTGLNSKADTSTVTNITERLTTAEASIKTNSDSIKQTVTKTEWTQDKQTINNSIAGKADNSKVTSLTNRLSTAEGSITTLSDQISLKASKTDVYTKGEVNSKVDSISVGGRNLITNSDFSETRNWGMSNYATYTSDGMNGKRAITVKRASPETASARVGSTNGILSMKDTIPKGTEFTLSAWVYVYDGGSYPSLTDDASSIFLRMWRKDNSTLWDVVNLRILRTQTKNGWVRLVGSGTTSYEAHGGSSSYPPQIGIYLSGYGMFKVSEVKLEYGNKATDWSPNPEDLIERIESAEAEIKVNADSITQTVSKTDYTGEKLVSMINQTADTVKIAAKNINLTGAVTFSSLDSSTQTKITTIESTASTAKSTADTAKSTATTAQTTANTAKTTADTAKSTADTAKTTATAAQTTANTAKSAADAAASKLSAWAHSSNTTLIDGSKIYTGSITAQQIASGAITADMIKAGKLTALNGRTEFDLNNSRLVTYNENKNPTLSISDGTLNFHDFEASGTGVGVFDTTVGSFFVETLTSGSVSGRAGINFDSGLSSAISLGYTANKFGRQAVVDIYGVGTTASSEGRMDVYGFLTVTNSMSVTGAIGAGGAITTSSTVKATGQVTSLSSVRGTTFTQSNYGLPIEIGKYIDMHQTSSANDVDVRLIARDRQGLQVARGDDLSRYVELGTGTDDRYFYNSTSKKYLAMKDNGRLTYDSYTVPHNWRQNFTPFIFSDTGNFTMVEAWGDAVYLGDLVWVRGRVRGSRGGHTGTIYIGGLPVSCIGGYPALELAFFGGVTTSLGTSGFDIRAYLEGNASHAIITYSNKDTGGWHNLQCSHIITGNIDISFSATYRWR